MTGVTHLNRLKQLPLKNVIIDDVFWGRYIRLVREKVIPYQWEVLNDRVPDAARSHCIKNFEIAAGKREGQFYGMVFQDSDLYKWLESVAYSLETMPDPDLEALADYAIELIGGAQQPDGYVNTYYTVSEPDGRWSNLQHGHELYCAGHMIEAAVAYFDAVGKREFLDISIRFADCIDNTFGPGDGKLKGYPGHQEIELALFKLYETTGERRYLNLAEYFIRERGNSPNYLDLEREKPGYHDIFPELAAFDRKYSQSHIPPVEQKHAVGHAVRAVYMYSAMEDLGAELRDSELQNACDALYDDIVQKKMYITGAIGSSSAGERFTAAYDLPNDLIYGETCASIGLMMLCRRMNASRRDARYADTMERALYNTVIAGISLSGTEFFYVNPLEVEPSKISANPNYDHVKPVRRKWFDCSCCPTNIARTVMGLGGYIYASSPEGLYVNLYCSGAARDGERSIAVKTDYPYGGEAAITVSGRCKLFLRSPECAPVTSVEINGRKQSYNIKNGYIELDKDWRGDEIRIMFDMRPKLVYCSPDVGDNIGRAAVMRGPLVYCIEQADNGERLGSFLLPGEAEFKESPPPAGLPAEAIALKSSAYKYRSGRAKLYSPSPPELESGAIEMIPYFLWANRGENEMRVYIPTVPILPESSG